MRWYQSAAIRIKKEFLICSVLELGISTGLELFLGLKLMILLLSKDHVGLEDMYMGKQG
jgi:hypothetical protein